MASVFTPAQQAAFEKDGYVLVRGLFDSEEISLMRSSIEQDPDLQNSLYNRKDAQGKATMMATWNHPGDSAYGLAARSERVIDTMEQMLGGEVYHYHSKLTAKEPLDGGRLGMAPGLRLLVPQRLFASAHGERHGGAGQGQQRKRLFASFAWFTQSRTG
jgi:hypothetical protein